MTTKRTKKAKPKEIKVPQAEPSPEVKPLTLADLTKPIENDDREPALRPYPAFLKECPKYLCDGLPRFRVKGFGDQLKYSDAYDALLVKSTIKYDSIGRPLLFTKNGILRIQALNITYLNLLKINLENPGSAPTSK